MKNFFTSTRSHRSSFVKLIAVASCFLLAGNALAQDDDDDDDELPFAEAQVLIQLNDTDGDLGFHARIDGDPWKRLTIESPDERTLLNVRLRGALRRQGLTEFAFESAEPTFDELDPDVFFDRFPEGTYEIEGVGFDGLEYESESELSHLIPAAPDNLMVSGVPATDDCDGAIPVASDPVVISWDEVDEAHATLGSGGDVEIDSYELAIEGDTIDYTVNVEADVTSIELASGALPSGEEIKFQVLVREEEGNETSSESCFIAP
ncbi:MAG: hypothetical protein KJO31_06255 [Gammaproteobacteria bacterium]|nr:hypothetical protein [Gammaproteobacteria bacterium]